MYRHTQRGWVVLVVCVSLAAFLAAISLFQREPDRRAPGLLSGVIPLLVMLLFHSLTVTVDDEWIQIRFGPGLTRKRIPLADVATCAPFTYPWWWGWGIRRVPTEGGWGLVEGWLYNVSGLQAVEIRTRDGHRFGIGTDEPEALCQAIRERLQS
jgi:hypothetical protein